METSISQEASARHSSTSVVRTPCKQAFSPNCIRRKEMQFSSLIYRKCLQGSIRILFAETDFNIITTWKDMLGASSLYQVYFAETFCFGTTSYLHIGKTTRPEMLLRPGERFSTSNVLFAFQQPAFC